MVQKSVTLSLLVLSGALLAPAAPPLSAACPTCTVSIGPHPPDLDLSGTSGGTCGQSWIGFFIDDGSVGTTKSCLEPSCSHNTTVDISCRRTGVHKVHAGCICGVSGTNPDGTPNCSGDTADAVTSLAINTTPTVAPSVTGPDASGAATLTTAYSFPNTRSALQRFLAAFDLRQGQQLGASFTPTESAGNWLLPLDTACWKQGPHQLKVVAIACGQDNDPAYIDEAFTTLTVNHEPQVSVSVEPAVGGGWATVHYSFPQTRSAAQRFVAVWAYPAKDLITSFFAEQEGERTVFVSCADGAHRLVVADALACNEVLRSGAAALPNCKKPPRKTGCNDPNQCPRCTGPGGGVPVDGGGPAFGAGKALGPGAELHYLAGGVGSSGTPGQAAWSTTLGRHWVHSYSERIVPATADLRRVWFLTQFGSFREYTDANGDGLYETVSPEDEYRTLTRAGSGWELLDLEGTATTFNASGLWTGQQDRHGSAKTATYAGGKLATVSFPDGRSELFSYDAASGKLAAITEVGVGGTEQRTWSYTWSGEDLIRVDRPDGISQRFVYGDSRHPGYMTRSILVGADAGDPLTARPERIEAAWEYDQEGNVVRAWRGADDFATGVDRYELAYDNPFEPRETTVTIYRNATEKDVVVYSLSRTAQWVGAKARVTAISGDCPACGLGPSSTLFYDGAQNPFRPTRIVDGRGIETQLAYDTTNGQVVSKTETAGTPESRTTEWEYHPTWPALPTRIDMPSTSGGAALRSTVLGYDAAGNLTSRRQQGVEDGSFFDLETVTTFNGAGQPLSIDPPGYAAVDQTSFTYDPARGDLLPLTRTDPLIGDTTFEHDAFNRRTAVVDPNGLRTETTYDAGNRVTTVTEKGAVPAEDLVTTHIYTPFGDLFRTTLPRGNLIEYGFDAAGRLISIERKPDAATPGERTLYTLDASGNRIKEELQRWDGTSWVTESFTDFVYLNRCQLHKTIHADGKATEFSYDCNGNLHETWDENHPRDGEPPSGGGGDDCDEPPCEPPPGGGPNPPTQVYEYDALDRLSSVSQPWAGGGNAITRYSYDLQDHLASVTDAEGNVTTYVHSDRDLMTAQVSPVSGATTYRFNEHAELVEQTDARGITMLRMVDALDRVTFVDYFDATLDTTYTWDDPLVPFSKGRLTAISRTGSTIAYGFDRFGRVTSDGELTYAHDQNGNRTEIGYPQGVTARWTHDFADREATLEIQVGAANPQPIVTAASSKPFGPLASLALGNGLSEARSFNTRYFPSRIEVPGRLDQVYTTDAVGNITSQNRAVGADHFLMTYAYQDPQYFLTQGNGPWGQQEWSYDRIGNRLSEAMPGSGDPPSGETFSYSYLLNPGGGHTPKLAQIEPAPGGDPGSFLKYGFDAAGNQTAVARSDGESCDRTSLLDYSAESRLSQLRTTDGTGTTELTYDGRGFLARSRLTFSTSPDFVQTEPVYSSEGLLLSRRYHQQVTRGGDLDTDPATMPVTKHSTDLFYFAGRPIAQLRRHQVGGGVDELLFLTTDHLGVSILATDASGALVWEGGLSPFGEPFLFPRPAPPGEEDPPPTGEESAASPCESVGEAGDSPALESAGLFLRYPGQWDDPSFHSHGLRGGLYYNLHRWYGTGTGRYTTLEPVRWLQYATHFLYAQNRPTIFIDPRGLVPCAGTPKPGQGTCCPSGDPSVGRAFRNLFARRSLYCTNKDKPAITVKQGEKKGWVEIPDDGSPTAHYKPQGNPCLDWCICDHENYHIEQALSGELRTISHNAAECRAYNRHLACLNDLTKEGPIVTGVP